jgi:hypothetical protein
VGGGQPFDLEIPLLRTIFYLFNRVETAGNCLFLELNGKYTLIIPGLNPIQIYNDKNQCPYVVRQHYAEVDRFRRF